MLKRLLVGAAASAFLAGTALAADIEAPPGPYDWTGLYVGLQAGVAFTGSNDAVDVDNWDSNGGVTELDSQSDFIGGATVGYNFQIEQFVFGVEGDFSYWGYEADEVSEAAGADTKYKAEADWLGTIRARVGLAFEQSLVYVTGGAAYSDLEYSVEDHSTAFPSVGTIDGSKDVEWGWTLGGGFEHAFDDSLTAKVEYLFIHFDDATVTGTADIPEKFDFDFDATEVHIIRAGLNWRF